jgi:MFS family permease
LSLSGTVVTLVALPVLVYRLSGSAFLTALVSALEAVPYLLFGLFAGALADRLDRRAVMVAADLANALVMGSVPLAHWLGVLTVPHVLAVAFLTPAIAVFFDGANFGALPVLVGRDRIATANAVVWSAATSVEIVLPALVGVALAVVDPASLLLLDALSFVASGLCVRAITRLLHDPWRPRGPLTRRVLFGDIGAGLHFLVHHAGVRTMTMVGTVQCLAGGGFVALLVVWCDRILGVGTEGVRFGLVYAGWSVGALAAAALLPRILRRSSAAVVALAALPFSAVLGILTSFATWWPLAALGLMCWGSVYTLVVVNSISYRQEVTPEALLGRVNTAGRMLSWGLGWTVGALFAGWLSHQIGVRPALTTMASLGLVAVAVAWTSPLRREQGEPATNSARHAADSVGIAGEQGTAR